MFSLVDTLSTMSNYFFGKMPMAANMYIHDGNLEFQNWRSKTRFSPSPGIKQFHRKYVEGKEVRKYSPIVSEAILFPDQGQDRYYLKFSTDQPEYIKMRNNIGYFWCCGNKIFDNLIDIKNEDLPEEGYIKIELYKDQQHTTLLHPGFTIPIKEYKEGLIEMAAF